MALKDITEEVRKRKNWKQSRISPGLIYTRISKQKIQSCKHVKPNNLHFDTNKKASIKFLFNIYSNSISGLYAVFFKIRQTLDAKRSPHPSEA